MDNEKWIIGNSRHQDPKPKLQFKVYQQWTLCNVKRITWWKVDMNNEEGFPIWEWSHIFTYSAQEIDHSTETGLNDPGQFHKSVCLTSLDLGHRQLVAWIRHHWSIRMKTKEGQWLRTKGSFESVIGREKNPWISFAGVTTKENTFHRSTLHFTVTCLLVTVTGPSNDQLIRT